MYHGHKHLKVTRLPYGARYTSIVKAEPLDLVLWKDQLYTSCLWDIFLHCSPRWPWSYASLALATPRDDGGTIPIQFNYACVISVHHMHAWWVCRPGEGVASPGTGVKTGCGRPCGYREPNLGPLEEQSMLFTLELSLGSKLDFFPSQSLRQGFSV